MVQTYSVYEITLQIKELLERGFGYVSIEGEISNFRPSAAGHLYFTLKDDKASIQAVMFKGKSRTLSFVPKDGMTVKAEGAISVYEQRGSYQIIIEEMSLAGEGNILKMLEERKQKLAAEGLFDSERKKALPPFPNRIAVITSPTGAAVRDIINVVKRRNEKIDIVVLPAIVQGEEAAPALIRQLKIADEKKLGDVIIIGRGGGSLEDLLPFSDEELVRAIAACKTLVISAVGHEIDWALSDFAADMRAPTPSAAAELAAPILNDIMYSIAVSREDLTQNIENRIERIRLMLNNFKPDSLELRFRNIQQPLLARFDTAKEEILAGMQDRCRDFKQRLLILNKILEGANPQAILDRGYSIVRNAETGKTIRSFLQVKEGERVLIQPSKGTIEAEIKGTTG
ncbi:MULTISPECIES: exodeoxyribonuclease VII large subunit [unclassified Treponema]|uniref:exodeoxyribonuclease VII large subunit n=1 Tax=unclassified Treponema TaxID=2638727 RepID=UPI0020A352C2|nr:MULTISPECIES: exodeoxyribonuclease VII large subunit [unclassified Treponema]UTC67492.1 exodeoxyribonuclease VII large subunit [Treponema sp. OMZ 789]UTC70220.1 exodeoxyribonuclease VII large subunit [Treponema sp. OMZ 790]UTC72935.1 exodeoxyribonuclease VII large subunit [Treponema sp. OMZ 791]